MTPALRGLDPAAVRGALDSGDPLPGAGDVAGSRPRPGNRNPTPVRGFAGLVDGAVVRDVLGRAPVYTERDDPTRWALDPDDLDDPDPVPAGHARTPGGDERVWSLPDPAPVTGERTAVERVRGAVRDSVDALGRARRARARSARGHVETEGLAVAFSGGVDSAAVAARLDAPLYVAGFPDSHDVEAARAGARAMGRDVRVVEVTHADLERAVPAVVAATGRTNAMDVGIAAGLYLVAERVAADGFDRLALGQGADELFGGYAKVAGAPDDPRVAADTVRGARRELVRTLPAQAERDVPTLRAAGVEPVTPLLDDRVVAAALALPGELLVSPRGERKWALRRAVREWVPDSVAFREKKALQYGSLVDRELDRLARRAGFKRRVGDHVTRYVESLTREDDGTSTRPTVD